LPQVAEPGQRANFGDQAHGDDLAHTAQRLQACTICWISAGAAAIVSSIVFPNVAAGRRHVPLRACSRKTRLAMPLVGNYRALNPVHL
jgi:hypothetical protein